MSFGDADLEYMLGHDFGEDVVYNGTTVKGQKDPFSLEELQGLGGGVLAEDIAVLIRRGGVSPTIGASITFAGDSYTVRNILHQDASLTRLHLRTGV